MNGSSRVTDRIYAREQGKGDRALVLLHGFGGHHMVWRDIQPALAREARVLAYDLPGHGASRFHHGAGSATAAAKAVLADLAERGIDKAHFAGYSMGGAIATLIALRAPETVASLTLLAPGGFGPEINAAVLGRLASAADADALRAAMNEMAAPDFSMPTKYVAGLAAVRGLERQCEILEEIHAVITKDGRQGEIPREALAGLAMPVTVIWGTRDPILPFSQARDLPPAFKLYPVEGAGHQLLVEAEHTIVRLIRQAMR